MSSTSQSAADAPERFTPADDNGGVPLAGDDSPSKAELVVISLGGKVKWTSPLGLIWLGVVTEIQGDRVRVHWDGKTGEGPLMLTSALTPYGR
jgi:hypothetical protein